MERGNMGEKGRKEDRTSNSGEVRGMSEEGKKTEKKYIKVRTSTFSRENGKK